MEFLFGLVFHIPPGEAMNALLFGFDVLPKATTNGSWFLFL